MDLDAARAQGGDVSRLDQTLVEQVERQLHDIRRPVRQHAIDLLAAVNRYTDARREPGLSNRVQFSRNGAGEGIHVVQKKDWNSRKAEPLHRRAKLTVDESGLVGGVRRQ